jgi:hypothetical protein
VIGDDKGDADDMRRRTANLEMVSWCPIASSRREEMRLETRRAEVSFGWRCLLRFATNYEERQVSADAPGHGKENGTREKAQRCCTMPESMMCCGKTAGSGGKIERPSDVSGSAVRGEVRRRFGGKEGHGFAADVASGSKEARSWRCYRRGRGKPSEKNEPTGGLHLSEEKKGERIPVRVTLVGLH